MAFAMVFSMVETIFAKCYWESCMMGVVESVEAWVMRGGLMRGGEKVVMIWAYCGDTGLGWDGVIKGQYDEGMVLGIRYDALRVAATMVMFKW